MLNVSEGEKVHYFKRLAPYLWMFRKRLAASVFLLSGARLLSLADPYLLKSIIDVLSGEAPAVFGLSVASLIILFFGIRFGGSILEGLKDLIMVRAETGMKKELGEGVFLHMLNLSIAFHTNRSTGGVARKITRGTQALDYILWMFSSNIVPTLLEIVFITSILVALFPLRFAGVLLVTAALHLSYTIFVTERRQKILLDMNKADDVAGGKIVDALLNYETVKYFNNEDYEYRTYSSRLKEWAQLAIGAGKSLVVLNIGQGTILAVGLTIMLYMAYQQYLIGETTIGDFVLITGYLIRIGIPLSFMGFVYRRAKEGLASLDEMIRLLEEPVTVKDVPGAKDLKVVEGEIVLKDVSFGYGDDREVLSNINLHIKPHERIAFVGYSGSGKSTMTKLIARFYDPTSGVVTFDGQNVHEVTQNSLRSAIGVVAQDAILFNGSIYENILYGRPGATKEEVEQAAKRANIHDFIVKELPEGYETVVGERGVKLSGGEKQRVAIARMLLKNPPVLVFDEATASLDTKAEKIIQESIQQISGEGKTTIVIAHRLSTIVNFDRIVVFEKGTIVEEGTHDELLKKGGRYAELWKLQGKEEGGE